MLLIEVPEKTFFLNIRSFESLANVIVSRYLHFKKAYFPIVDTCEGIEMLSMDDSENALLSIVWSFELFANSIVFNCRQLKKAPSPIRVTWDGIVMLSIDV